MILRIKDNTPQTPLLWFFLIMLFISAMVVSGCASDFAHTRSSHAREFPRELSEKTENLLPANQPLDLEACIDIALANNLDIKIADIKGRLAGIDRNIAFSYFLPLINAQATHLENNKQQMQKAMGSYAVMSDKDITQSVISGQLSVFNPSTWFLYNAHKKGKEVQDLVAERVRQAIRLQVTALYLACLSQESSGKAVESSVQQAEALLMEMEALYREGLILKSDLEDTRTFLASRQNRLRQNRRQRKEAGANLMEAMGLSPLDDIALRGTPDLTVDNGETSQQILKALMNRLELKATDRNISIKKDSVKMAIADFLPGISVFSEYNTSSNSFQYYESILSYGVSGVLTIFDGFANIQEYRAAKEEHKQAMLEREQSCMKIMLEVIEAGNALDQAIEQRELVSMELESSKRNLEEVEALWREGMVKGSDKLNAVSRYTAARANFNMANYQYLVAAATMKDVMGLSGKEETSGKTN